jgi:hypothetical protein
MIKLREIADDLIKVILLLLISINKTSIVIITRGNEYLYEEENDLYLLILKVYVCVDDFFEMKW